MKFHMMHGAMMLAASSAGLAAEPAATQQRVMSAPSGRYVFGQISEYRRDQYMLDTATGRLWRIVARKVEGDATGDGMPLLQAVPYDAGNSLSVTPK